MLRSVFLIVLCGMLGCSPQQNSITDLGNRILETTGILPAREVFSAGNSIIHATKIMGSEEEYYFGRAVAARILSLYPRYQNDALDSYINRIGASLAAVSERPETFGGYHIAVLDTPEVNAISAPGGFIFITKGMLQLVSDEDALASILAHEVIHVARQHGLKAISESELNKAILSTGKLAGSLSCNSVLSEATQVFEAAVQNVVETLLEKGYSREQEFEADAGATSVLQAAGYDAHSILAAFDALKISSPKEKSGWFKTHPDPDERKNSAAKYMNAQHIDMLDVGKLQRAKRFQEIVATGRS